MVDQTIGDLAPILGKRAACVALGRARASYYRRHRKRARRGLGGFANVHLSREH